MNNISSRKQLMAMIHYIEEELPIDKWTIKNHQIWPLIRITLAFNVIQILRNLPDKLNNNKSNEPIKKKRTKLRFISFIYRNFIEIIKLLGLFYKFRKYNYVFAGASTHRQLVNNTFYNKFYDSIIDDLKSAHEKILIIEYTSRKNYSNKKISNEKNTIFIEDYINIFITFRKYIYNRMLKNVRLEDYHKFLTILKENKNIPEPIIDKYTNSADFILNSQFFTIYLFFLTLFKVINPKLVFELCYYDPSMLALNSAANKLGIRTIEIQHGPQTLLHPAYGAWLNSPKNGFRMHPAFFGVWDKKTKDDLLKGICNHDKSRILMLGNPWHQFWVRNSPENFHINNNKNIILITLQPLESYMDNFLIETIIKTKDKYNWWIRIHPQQLIIKEKIISFIREKKIYDFVNIKDATNLPLPFILRHIKLHITKTSGTTLEAEFFGIKTISIHDLGKEYYPELIKEGKVLYLNEKTSDNLIHEIEKQIINDHHIRKEMKINYLQIIHQLV